MVRFWIATVVCCLMATAASAQKLTRQKFVDGSGSIGVATGWKIGSSANGAVSLAGPSGATMDLGIPMSVVTRGVERLYPEIPNPFPGSPRVDFNDPVRAGMDLIAFAAKALAAKGQSVRILKIKAVEPVRDFQNGRAAYIHITSSINGKSFDTFGLWAIMPVDNTQGIFYTSAVSAPTAEFDKMFPTMMAMWQSWSLSDSTIKKRLNGAAEALGRVDYAGTVDSVVRERRRVAEKAAEQYSGYIRQ